MQHNQLTFTHPLQYIDCKSHGMYPVAMPKDQVRIVIVPHGKDKQAQYLMAGAYRVLREQTFDKIIVIHQIDSVAFHGVALPYAIDEKVLIQTDTIEKLSYHRLFRYYQEPFFHNDGMQLQFTFLDFYIKNNPLFVPLIIGHISRDDAFEIAATLVDFCSPKTLIIMSADIALHTHVTHNCPLDQSEICNVYDRDSNKIQIVQSGSLQQKVDLFDDGYKSSIFALLFELLQLSQFKNIESEFVGYATSYCQDSKHAEDIESYGAFIFQDSQFGYRNHIGSYEQLQLLQYARLRLYSLFQVQICRLPCMISYEMSQPHGIFVSLYAMSDHGIILRGCMGKVQSKIPLFDMVYHMTKQAACNDMRFYPLQYKDLDNTIVSISVVTDFKRISQYDEIREFDGVLLQYDDNEAISLPAKIINKDWEYQSLLVQLSQQMGLSDFIWKNPCAKIFTFSSLVFQEE